MAVVAAGVHPAGALRRVRLAAGFLERQAVHVGAQHQARAARARIREDAGSADARPRREAEGREAVRDDPGRATLLERELRMRVEVPARLHEPGELSGRKFGEERFDAGGEGRHGGIIRAGLST